MNADTIATSPPQLCPDEPEAGNYFVAAYPPFSVWDARHLPALESALAQPHSGGLGLYIHLPFCQHKCDYCYYLSYIPDESYGSLVPCQPRSLDAHK